MTDEASQKLALLAEKMKGQVCEGETAEDCINWVMKAATDVGFDAGIGAINFAARNVNGIYSVQFNIENRGYSSQWPVWAYEIALAALVNRKKVLVISSGEPFGGNLMQVYIVESEV